MMRRKSGKRMKTAGQISSDAKVYSAVDLFSCRRFILVHRRADVFVGH